jgi:hypothetical protein
LPKTDGLNLHLLEHEEEEDERARSEDEVVDLEENRELVRLAGAKGG